MIERLKLWILRRLIREYVKWISDVRKLYAVVRLEVAEHYFEDNVFTIDEYLRAAFESTQHTSHQPRQD